LLSFYLLEIRAKEFGTLTSENTFKMNITLKAETVMTKNIIVIDEKAKVEEVVSFRGRCFWH